MSNMYGCPYYDPIFAQSKNTRYAHCEISIIRFLLSNFVRGPDSNNNYLFVREYSSQCIVNGTCNFIGKSCHVRVVTRLSNYNSRGVHIFFFDKLNYNYDNSYSNTYRKSKGNRKFKDEKNFNIKSKLGFQTNNNEIINYFSLKNSLNFHS